MQDNQIIKIDNPFKPFDRKCKAVPYMRGRKISDLLESSDLTNDFIVLINGALEENYSRILAEGDVIHIYPKLQNDNVRTLGMIAVAVLASYYVGPAVAGYLQPTWGATAAGVAGALATVAVTTVGGILLQPGMSTSSYGSNRTSEKDESPTYGWDVAINPAKEGLAIPVIYGEVASYPTIINQWIDTDSSGEQWAHTVLCVAEGLTNNLPTADTIYAEDQLLSLYEPDDYTLVTTDGGPDPEWGGNTDFTRPHQMRKIDRQLRQSIISRVLLNCNGTNGSTTIVDSTLGGNNDWTCQGSAALSTTDPFITTGTNPACLSLPGSGDYISCDDSDALNIFTRNRWTFECRWRQATLANSGIAGQQMTLGDGSGYYWSILYDHDNTKIRFQQYYRDSLGAYTIYFNASENATLSVDTWHHICVIRKERNDEYRIYIMLDGVKLGYTAATTTDVAPSGGTWAQYVGRAQQYQAAGPTDTTRYGNCRLDEVRLTRYGDIYSHEGFTAPTDELAETDVYQYTTKGSVDNFAIILTAPFGLYWTETDGGLDDEYVQFWIGYRAEGTSDWTFDYVLFTAKQRTPYRERYEYTGLNRNKYEIIVGRLTTDYITYGNASTTRSQSTTMLSYIDEYLSVDLTYPYLQCIGISLKAQDQFSGTIPKFRVVSNRSSIEVPKYNGYGYESLDPTTNPYAVRDMITNEVYGLGIDPLRIDETEFEEWADWCTGAVASYQRCSLNMIFDQVATVDDALQHVEACGRAVVIRRGTDISCNINKPSTAQILFGVGNIVPGSDHIKWIRQSEKVDGVEITYRDKALDYVEETVSHYSSNFHTISRVPRIARININGINNKEQAEREAILRQQINDSIKRSCELQTGLEAIPVLSGDVINYQGSVNSFSGRLPLSSTRTESWTGTTVYLDQEINLDSTTFSGNCILFVRDPDDTLQSYTVTGPFDTDIEYVTISSSGTFNQWSPWAICRSTGDIYKYRITNMQRSNKLDIKIDAYQYDEDAYYNNNYEGGGVAI